MVATFAIMVFVHECQGFSPIMIPRHTNRVPIALHNLDENLLRWRKKQKIHHWTRQMAATSDDVAFLSDDPFVILGLDEPTADKKVIKRAYKKRALKFHPDVITDIHSTPEDKKKASDRFSKINGAYEQLMGKSSGSSSSGNSSASSSSSSGYTPPHRRTSSYKSPSSSSSYSEGSSTDWRDYMPGYEKEDYDTGGDSFGQIFSDLVTGAASAAVSGGVGGLGGGIFNEFLEFLEGGASASGFGAEDDADLRTLLQTGTLEEVAEEMQDTEMVVQQLDKKSRGLDDEIFAMDAEAKMTSKFSERIELEEKGASLKARKDVVNGYLDRARKRLLSLQTRYKDLKAYGGANDDYAASSRSRSSWNDIREEAKSTTERSSTSSYSQQRSSSYGSTNTDPTSTSGSKVDSDGEDSWMNEGFGSSSGRGRGGRRSGRRRAASRSRSSSPADGIDSNPPSPSPAPSPSYSATSKSNGNAYQGRQSSSRNTTTSTSSRPSSSSAISKSNNDYDLPPHRRTGASSFASRQEADRKRMQDIKVDEEFEKLKKELGL